MSLDRIRPLIAMTVGAVIAGFLAVSIAGAISSRGVAPDRADTQTATADADAILEAAISEAARVGNQEQRDALSDRVVTVEEYAHATNQMIGCLENAGFKLDGVGRDWSGLTYDYGFTGADDREKDYQTCYDTHAVAVDTAYQMLLDETRLALLEETVDCLETMDVDLGETRLEDGSLAHPAVIMIDVESKGHEENWNQCVELARTKVAPGEVLPKLSVER